MRLRLLIVLSLGLFISCSNDFDLTEEKKDIPVVYGLLNPQDTAHYIRIERAFIDESISALEISQRPDSLYYADINASIVDLETSERYTLTKVDGNLEGYIRNEGVFAQAPNYLYKLHSTDFLPIDNRNYRLEIDRGDNKTLVTAETVIVDNPTIISPPPGPETTLSFNYNLDNPAFVEPYHFEWKLTEGVIFDLTLRLKYQEQINQGEFVSKELDWKIARGIQDFSYDLNNVSFYTFLAGNIEEDATAIRLFQNIDLVLESGGQTILDYVNIGQANLGITSSQDVPTFTNLSEGVGIFSSRNSITRENVSISGLTRDSLINGSITKHLNFIQ